MTAEQQALPLEEPEIDSERDAFERTALPKLGYTFEEAMLIGSIAIGIKNIAHARRRAKAEAAARHK